MNRLLVALAVLLAVGAGCSSAASTGSGGGVSVVASTNVWGDVAKQVAGALAGGKVDITSIISDPSADPHSYEANTRNQLAIKRANLVIENGGGYDDFVRSMRSASGTRATVLDAVQIAGRPTVGGELNEHVWYDFPAVEKVAAQIADALVRADPADAATYRANARTFTARVQQLVATEASIKAAYAGAGAAITEPVPLYLLDACGLVNRTPAAFSQAIEAGDDVPARVLQQTLDLFSHRDVSLLAYNSQTSGAQTDRVRAAAQAAHVPVVPVTETLPAGKDYVSWMAGNLSAVRSALASAG